jgi:hypothetical protein
MGSTMTIQSNTTLVTWMLRKLTTIMEKEGSIRNHMDMKNKMRRTESEILSSMFDFWRKTSKIRVLIQGK